MSDAVVQQATSRTGTRYPMGMAAPSLPVGAAHPWFPVYTGAHGGARRAVRSQRRPGFSAAGECGSRRTGSK
ncbi:hypothetical protein GCM10009600_21460 [Oerskovia paurometabola]